MSDGLSNERKIQVISGLLEREVLEWFLGSKFYTWLELEDDFLQTWCVATTLMDVIVKEAKRYQTETNIFVSMPQSLKNFGGFLSLP